MPHTRFAGLALTLLAAATVVLAARSAPAQNPVSGGITPEVTVTIPNLTHLDLAGRSIGSYPFFEYDLAFFESSRVEMAIDPSVHPSIVGRTADVYVTAHNNVQGWVEFPHLDDLRGLPTTVTFQSGGVRDNTFLLDNGQLSGAAGTDLGVPYDIVIDFDRNGLVSPGDFLDGDDEAAGFYVLYPTAFNGPLSVTETLYSGGTWLGQDLYYPTNIAALGELPLVIVSHGNGHNYQWYDHIGFHLASYGYIVMSHTNDTMPGIESASTTTLQNVDYLLANLATIAGGALAGHVDKHRQTWIGHSRGGEGVVRAFARLTSATYVPQHFTVDDIALVSSMAPTDFLGPVQTNPWGVNYSLWVGGADNDVSGCADCDLCQSFHLHDRALLNRQSISLHGAGHGCFHAGNASTVATGPCLVTRAETHQIMKAYLLPLVKRYVENNIPARDCLWRQWESFRSPGVPTTACAVVDLQYRPVAPGEDFVVDDFQTQSATTTSSSGGSVSFSVTNVTENRLDDANTAFTTSGTEPFNGMTSGGPSDTTRGLVFDWDQDRSLTFEVLPAATDATRFRWLSFRAAQAPRHANTIAVLGDLSFSVRLRDGNGGTSAIAIGAYGGGIEEPYQRSGCGTGTGWGGEFETIRLRLADFTRDGSPLDLTHLVAIEFLFGPTYGSAQGRLAFDDLTLAPR